MLAKQNLITDFEKAIGAQQCIPFINFLDQVDELLNAHDRRFTEQERKIQEIYLIRAELDNHKRKHDDLKTEVKKDLLVELATKADIAELKGLISLSEERMEGNHKALEEKINGKINSLEERINGRINSLEEKIKGEFKSIRLWMKVIVGVAVVGMGLYSPAVVELIKFFKV